MISNTITEKRDVFRTISYAIREIGRGQLDELGTLIETRLAAAIARLGKNDFAQAGRLLAEAAEACPLTELSLAKAIDDAQSVFCAWERDRPELAKLEAKSG